MSNLDRSNSDRLVQSITRSPILWGTLTSAGFYGLIYAELLGGDFVGRYFTSHPVEYIAATMFFIGMAAMVRKLFDVLAQYAVLSESLLGPKSPEGQTAANCEALLGRLDRLPSRRQNDYLVRRLREATEHVRRRGSADTLDDQLKYLADVEADRLHASFALIRVIIWAIPILGFLGTVIGITLAIANLSPEALENSLPDVTAGLAVAFDTTALALGLSIVLMFTQFLTDRIEGALLARVDQLAVSELEDRFERIPEGPQGQVVAVRRMAATVVEATERLVCQQVELWQESMEASNRRWAGMAESGAKQLQSALAAALQETMQVHSQRLAAAEQGMAQQNQRHWQQVQQAQAQSMQTVNSMQTNLVRQGEVLNRAIEATGEVVRLEEALNRNLAALSGAKHFEQTVMSLAATIHLLNGRLTEDPVGKLAVQLATKKPTPHAA